MAPSAEQQQKQQQQQQQQQPPPASGLEQSHGERQWKDNLPHPASHEGDVTHHAYDSQSHQNHPNSGQVGWQNAPASHATSTSAASTATNTHYSELHHDSGDGRQPLAQQSNEQQLPYQPNSHGHSRHPAPYQQAPSQFRPGPPGGADSYPHQQSSAHNYQSGGIDPQASQPPAGQYFNHGSDVGHRDQLPPSAEPRPFEAQFDRNYQQPPFDGGNQQMDHFSHGVAPPATGPGSYFDHGQLMPPPTQRHHLPPPSQPQQQAPYFDATFGEQPPQPAVQQPPPPFQQPPPPTPVEDMVLPYDQYPYEFHSIDGGEIPQVPYHDLPAGLMVPLVKVCVCVSVWCMLLCTARTCTCIQYLACLFVLFLGHVDHVCHFFLPWVLDLEYWLVSSFLL